MLKYSHSLAFGDVPKLDGTFCDLYDLTSPFYITKHLRNSKNRKVKIIFHVLAFYKRTSSFNLLGT